MVCDICGEKEATVHLTEIINNQVTKLHLCEECAREKGAEMEEHFGLADLLAGLADLGAELPTAKDTKLKCHNCGMAYSDFKQVGRLGCAECYKTFKMNLVPLLRRIHGSDQHIGKTPKKIAVPKEVPKEEAEIEALRAKLQKAIHMEEFEEAAKLRDKIKELEAKITRKKK